MDNFMGMVALEKRKKARTATGAQWLLQPRIIFSDRFPPGKTEGTLARRAWRAYSVRAP